MKKIKTFLFEVCERCVTQEQAEAALKQAYGEKVKVTPLEQTALGKLLDNYRYERRKLQDCLDSVDHIMRQVTEIFEGARKSEITYTE